ncbi:hypothetical protein Q7P37_000112 [Cladosporium fusiforme]
MSGIGAELPPHLLAKRKRQQEEESQNAPSTASGAKRSPSPATSEKRRKVAGPAMPPAPLEERPTEPANRQEDNDDDSSSDDDDFGPSLPPAGGASTSATPTTTAPQASSESTTAAQEKPQRDDWMTMPPEQDGLASRMDPSKLRARGFNTGKGAKAPAEKGGDSSSWHETPEQKRKRLEDEMMGVSRPSPATAAKPGSGPSKKKEADEAAERALKERTAKARGPSLVEQHQGRNKPDQAEDDPSARSFDREKDMSIGGLNRVQKKDMLKQAGGFSSKFSGGGYL